MREDILTLGPAWYVCFLFSLTCHEAAHALAARRGGDRTAYEGGQMTLNPLPHVRRSPFGTILVPIVTFLMSGWMIGWASAPYDPVWQQRHPHRAAWMALAGPMANLGLVILAGAAIHGGILAGLLAAPERVSFTHIVSAAEPGSLSILATFLSILFSLNLLLAVFNLIPVPPLDGISAIGLLLPRDAALRVMGLARFPAFTLLGIVIAWRVAGSVLGPAFRIALNLLYPGADYR
jgi:Zn-dependent protease